MTKIITIIIALTMCSFAKADESDSIKEFLATRPSYKKIDFAAYEKESHTYFCDSAYRSERENIIVTVLVRNSKIMAYIIKVNYSRVDDASLSNDDISKTLETIYGTNGFVRQYVSSEKDGLGFAYVHEKRREEAKLETILKLSEKLKP